MYVAIRSDGPCRDRTRKTERDTQTIPIHVFFSENNIHFFRRPCESNTVPSNAIQSDSVKFTLVPNSIRMIFSRRKYESEGDECVRWNVCCGCISFATDHYPTLIKMHIFIGKLFFSISHWTNRHTNAQNTEMVSTYVTRALKIVDRDPEFYLHVFIVCQMIAEHSVNN